MKTMEDMKERAGEFAETAQKKAKKAAYAVMGAPRVARRRVAEYRGRVTDTMRRELDTWAAEGERLMEEMKSRNVVTEWRERVDFEHLQDRVEKLRDQLEDVLANWREQFRPVAEKAEEPAPTPQPEAKKPATSKPAARKPAAKKPAAQPAAKKPATKPQPTTT